MKIKYKLYLSALISIILSVVFMCLVFVVSDKTAKKREEHRLTKAIETAISELDIITYEYLLYREKRMEDQWNTIYNSGAVILRKAEKEGLKRIRDDYVKLGRLFLQVRRNYKKAQSLALAKVPQEKIDAVILLEKRLVTQLLIKSRSIFTESSMLSHKSYTEMAEIQRLANTLLLIVMAVLAMAITTISILVARNMSITLDKLIKGTGIIGGGNLEYKLKVDNRDEFSKLSEAFNKMTEDLKLITSSRDELNIEIAERKRVEEELRQHQYHLDELVRKRTAEIEAVNKELEAEIVERKRSEEGLRKSEEKYHDLYNSAPIPYFSVGTDDMIKGANIAAQDFTGYTLEELQKMKAFNLYANESKAKAKQLFETFVNGTSLENEEMIYEIKNGKKIHGILSVNPIRNENGQILESRSVVVDITDRKRAEEKIKEYTARLEEMVEERTKDLKDAQEQLVRHEKLAVLGQMAGGVGHELRNPLGVMSNAVYYLNTILSEADETTKEYLEIISSEISNADKIVSDLLDFSRVKPAEREEIAFSELVAQVLEKQQAPENVEVTITIPPDLPAVFVDPKKIGQVLVNLVTNAYQAMPDGGRLTVRAREEPDKVSFSITDTGCGISKENMKNIFEPLFTTKAHGIGLGLAVSRSLVEANGGSIQVESEEGKGSTFTLVLPTKEAVS